MIREAHKIQNTNNHISKTGLIRLYQHLLSKNRIQNNGSAHRRLRRLMSNKINWWDKI